MTSELDIGVHRIGPMLAEANHVDRWWLLGSAIVADISNGARRALLGDSDETLYVHRIWVYPRPRRVGLEDRRCLQHTEAGVDATSAVEPDRYVAANGLLDRYRWRRRRLRFVRLSGSRLSNDSAGHRSRSGSGDCGRQGRCDPRQVR